MGARLTTLFCKYNYWCEIQIGENRLANMEESSKEDYGSKRTVFPMMMMMMMMMMKLNSYARV
jgi:hypothetical protein